MNIINLSNQIYINNKYKNNAHLQSKFYYSFQGINQDLFEQIAVNNRTSNSKIYSQNSIKLYSGQTKIFANNFFSNNHQAHKIKNIYLAQNLPLYKDEYQKIKKLLLLPLFNPKDYNYEPKNIMIASDKIENSNYLFNQFGENITNCFKVGDYNDFKFLMQGTSSPQIIYFPNAYKIFINDTNVEKLKKFTKNTQSKVVFSTKYPNKLTPKLKIFDMEIIQLPEITKEETKEFLNFYFDDLQMKGAIADINLKVSAQEREKIADIICNYSNELKTDINTLLKLIEETNYHYYIDNNKPYIKHFCENYEKFKTYGGI